MRDRPHGMLWLVSDRVAASGSGRAIECSHFEGSPSFVVMARAVDGSGTITVTIETGPDEAGPWTALASVAGEGSVAGQPGVPADRLDAWLRASYDIPGSETFDVAAALTGSPKYASQATVAGAADITGTAGGGGPSGISEETSPVFVMFSDVVVDSNGQSLGAPNNKFGPDGNAPPVGTVLMIAEFANLTGNPSVKLKTGPLGGPYTDVAGTTIAAGDDLWWAWISADLLGDQNLAAYTCDASNKAQIIVVLVGTPA
jgi:hypothetical protein